MNKYWAMWIIVFQAVMLGGVAGKFSWFELIMVSIGIGCVNGVFVNRIVQLEKRLEKLEEDVKK